MSKSSIATLNDLDRQLVEASTKCGKNAYAPYSKFHVGAALRATSGEVYTGVNVENSSFGLTICAERMALGAAITAGEREFDAIAISTSGGHMPCGACRQMLAEFGDMQVLAADVNSDTITLVELSALLPESFRYPN